MRIGIISDTHGLLRPEAVKALQGADHLLHIGDVGKPEILTELRKIASLHVVRGNVDRGSWAAQLPQTEVVELGGQLLYMLHILEELDLDPAAAGFRVVLFGHSHQPTSYEKEGVLYLNPGSAGPRRFALPVSLAWLNVEGSVVESEIIHLL
jgi:hypothetical protein